MNIRDLINCIDNFAPFSSAEEWDNSGLMVGNYKAEVKRVGICLDAVSDAVVEADNQGCNVLLCHHPLIFRAIKRIDINNEPGKTISEAIKRDINIISAHTNWDKADDGVNSTLAKLLGLENCKPLDDFGFCGNMAEELSLKDFSEYVKKSWNISRLDIYSDNFPEKISRVALCGGSGAEFWRAAKLHRADIYLTADMKYHELIDANKSGMTIGLMDHGEMERASLNELAEKISSFGIETVLLNINALKIPLRL